MVTCKLFKIQSRIEGNRKRDWENEHEHTNLPHPEQYLSQVYKIRSKGYCLCKLFTHFKQFTQGIDHFVFTAHISAILFRPLQRVFFNMCLDLQIFFYGSPKSKTRS